MADRGRRTKAQIAEDERVEREKQEKIANLETYGLAPRENIRYRRGPGATWSKGRALYVNIDGSICIGDVKTARLRDLLPGDWEIEREGVGPRGGTVWESITV